MTQPRGDVSTSPEVLLPFAEGLSIPLRTAVVQRYAFVGMIGAGKSNGAQVLAEGFLEHRVQSIVIDVTGIWSGLRLGRDGISTGFDIPVLGGKNGDDELDVGKGALYADWVVDKSASVVLDLVLLRPGKREKFVADFIRQFYFRKKTARLRTPVHVFLEEAHRYIPQHAESAEERESLSIAREMAELGRNFGIGISLCTQAPQAVHKRVLNLTECLIVFQLAGAHERKAIREWVSEQGVDVAEQLAALPQLERGEAVVWSPRWLKVLRRVEVHLKRTFDASSTLEFGEEQVSATRPLPPSALSDLRAVLDEATRKEGAAIAEVKDLAAARVRIRALEAQVAGAARVVEVPVEVERVVTVPALDEAQVARLERAAAAANDAGVELRAAAADVTASIAAARPAPSTRSTVEGVETSPRAPRPALVALPSTSAARKLDRGAREMLAAIGMFSPAATTRARVATLTGIQPRGSTFRTYLSQLRTADLVVEDGEQLRASTAGLAALGPARRRAPPTTATLLELWGSKLDRGARAMLQVLVDAHPRGVARETLAAKASEPGAKPIDPAGSTFRTYLSQLRVNGLAAIAGDVVRASEDLFRCTQTD